jgi:hypothetical protein
MGFQGNGVTHRTTAIISASRIPPWRDADRDVRVGVFPEGGGNLLLAISGAVLFLAGSEIFGHRVVCIVHTCAAIVLYGIRIARGATNLRL